MSEPCSCPKNTDRYVSFAGIDCDGMASKVMEHIDRHLAIPERNNEYWEYFNRKRSGEKGPKYGYRPMLTNCWTVNGGTRPSAWGT